MKIKEFEVRDVKPGWYIMGIEEDHTHVIHNGPYFQHSAAELDMHNFTASKNGNYIANEGGITLDELRQMEEQQHKADGILEMCKGLRMICEEGLDPISGGPYPKDSRMSIRQCVMQYVQFMEEGMK